MTCSIEGCERPVQARGMCSKHYARVRRNGTTDTVHRQTEQHFCSIAGCGKPTEALGLCLMHYSRRRRGSDVAVVPEQVRGGTLAERIHRRTPQANADGCQVWDGQVQGSTQLPVLRYRTSSMSVRRVLWAEANPGHELAEGQWVVMTCGTPRCVATEHMRLTTASEYNAKDMVSSR